MATPPDAGHNVGLNNGNGSRVGRHWARRTALKRHHASRHTTPLTALIAAVLAVAGANVAEAQLDALEALQAGAKAAPRDAAAQTELGRALLRAGRLDEAERTLKKAAQLQRASLGAAYEVLKVTFERGDHRAARGACGTFKKVAADTPYEHLCFARAFLIWRRSSRAMEYLGAALALDPDHIESLIAVGDAERISGSYDAATQAYERVRTLAPQRLEAVLGLARIAIARGEKETAIQLLRAVRPQGSTWPEVTFELGRLVQGSEAVDLLRQAVAFRANWNIALLALGEALVGSGQFAEAEQIAVDVTTREPGLAEGHTLLGRARQALGNRQGAEVALSQALTLVPNLPEATLARADLYAEMERYEEAFAEYQNAAGLRPLDVEPMVRAARLCVRLQRMNLAAAYLDRALDRAPQSAVALALYGDLLVARGDRAEAKVMYERALQGTGLVDRAAVEDALRKLNSAS